MVHVMVADSVDWVSLVLVGLQMVLLLKIARLAKALRIDRLLAAANFARVTLAARGTTEEGRSREHLDELTVLQREMLERVHAAYLREGGEDDKLWEPFLLRFLIDSDWSEASAMQKLLPAVKQRSRVRSKMASGWNIGMHPGYVGLLRTCGFLLQHRRALSGDLLTIADIGSLNTKAWMQALPGDEFADVMAHVFEWLSYEADALSIAERRMVRVALLLDYQTLTWAHLDPRILLRLQPVMQALSSYHPQLVGRAACTNASPLFVHLWGQAGSLKQACLSRAAWPVTAPL